MGISTHILNTALGQPAADVPVALYRMTPSGWSLITESRTDPDGRAATLLPRDAPAPAGLYRLSFATGAYFGALGIATLYPEVEVQFEVRAGERHYHLPLLLTPNSYTTYRGS